MKKLLSAVLILGLSVCAGAADPVRLKKGELAPPLSFEKIIKGKPKAVKSWADLKGKAVVLEFWGIDCEPCVENIPHMNALVEKFKGKPVVFLSASRDTAAALQDFLKTHEMKGTIAAAAKGAFKNYGVNSIPRTVLVDKAGVVQAVTYPSEVTEKTIEDLLAGRELEEGMVYSDEKAGVAANAVSYFSVSPSSGGMALSYSDSSFKAVGMTLDYAIQVAMRGVHGRDYRDVPYGLLDGKYDISAGVQPGAEDSDARLRELIMAGLNGAFPFRMAAVKKVRKVYLLKKFSGAKPEAVLAPGKGGSRKGRHSKTEANIEASGIDMKDFAGQLEEWLGLPVLDETGFGAARYALKLEVAPVDPETVSAALKEKLGLELAEAEREVEIIEVTGVKKP